MPPKLPSLTTSTKLPQLETLKNATSITLVNTDFPGDPQDQVNAALNTSEGFALVLADLKVLLETGASPGIVAAKARLIEARQNGGDATELAATAMGGKPTGSSWLRY